MEKRINELKLSLLELTLEYIKKHSWRNNQKQNNARETILMISKALELLTYPIKWSYAKTKKKENQDIELNNENEY